MINSSSSSSSNNKLRSIIILSSLIIISISLFSYLILLLLTNSNYFVTSSLNNNIQQQHTSKSLTKQAEDEFLEDYFKKQSLSSTTCSIEQNEGTLTREIIGPHVWNVFHAFVENYNNNHEINDDKLLQWIQLTTELFPCKQCSNDFRGILKQFPYKGFESFYGSKSKWMCKLHNLVNRKTNKDNLFDCSDKNLLVKYKLQKC